MNDAQPSTQLPDLNVKLAASFGGLKALPWFAWGHNSLGPRLILRADTVEFRLFRTRLKRYDEIELVDYRSTWRTFNIVLTFKDQISAFIGNTGEKAAAREAVSILRARGCPLSERASQLLADKPS